ncbi:catalase family protein [Sphingomonas sp. KR1UV-12]|uniref:Catalase family protein n=1 Tax=Sphingomonas aurea TaxID=3063994 RepID=A0ABT9EKI0_9SPHN|nr:catalase family protein [Sphingomonas sp. KR1UV-12]MDP1027474.1 catalase family protein [Sphingomonas sp. KR1UV-12]
MTDTATLKAPVRYDPSVETVQPDEGQVIHQLEDSFRNILETTSKDYGHAERSVHAKAHGIATGTLTVHDGLPPELAQGLFARPGTYEAVLRISTNAGDILDDSIALPRGLALKIIGVEGERLPGSEGDATQDLILVNGPAFSAPDAKAFSKNLKLLASTTDKAEGAKKLLSGVLRAFEATLEAVGLESATLQTLGGAPQVHPLGETYYSQTPFRYGDYIAKFSLAPVSPALTQLTGDTVTTTNRPDALREVVSEVLVSQGGTWELRVQLSRDLEAMPVEDPTKVWDEKDSPFQTVATLEVAPQPGWEHGTSDKINDALSYNIWHGLAAHRPLGNINRARNDTYKFSADYRGRFNGCPMHEPRQLADLP